jgi:hypothetical protein
LTIVCGGYAVREIVNDIYPIISIIRGETLTDRVLLFKTDVEEGNLPYTAEQQRPSDGFACASPRAERLLSGSGLMCLYSKASNT